VSNFSNAHGSFLRQKSFHVVVVDRRVGICDVCNLSKSGLIMYLAVKIFSF